MTMAGRGPAPKDPDKRARGKRSDPTPLRVIYADPTEQPDLPEFEVQIEAGGELVSQTFQWPARTRQWWQMWADSPLSDDFTSTDWSELLDTAILHARLWSGDHKVASELRLRTAKYGSTPEDRARLRIQFAQAEEADEKRATPRQTSRDRYGPRAVASD